MLIIISLRLYSCLSYRYANPHDSGRTDMCVLIFYTTLSETLLTLRIILRDIVTHAHRYLCTAPVILVRFQRNFNFLD